MKVAPILVVLTALVAGNASAAPATPPDKTFDISKVEALFEKGQRHYDLGEYPAAIEAFKSAYAMMPDPSFLFNLGQSYRQMRNCRDARASYKAYLRHAPDDDRAKVVKFISDMEACIRAEEARLAALQPPPQPPRSKRYRWAGMATAGAGVLAIGTGALFAIRVTNAEGDLERACREGCTTGEIADIDRRGRNAARISTGMFVGGGALIATGIGIALYSMLRYERMVILPILQPGAAGVGASVRF
jgi:hypothetical protein